MSFLVSTLGVFEITEWEPCNGGLYTAVQGAVWINSFKSRKLP